MKKGEKVALSKRLHALADMVTPGNTVADVGCDHGFLSIYLVQNHVSPRVLAMDVRSGPLLAAITHVQEYGLTEYISTRLSDGIREMKAGECDTLVIAGMGGRLMTRILSEDSEKTGSFHEMILQPQSEIPQFRKFLRESGYAIVDENMICEDGKYYPMMKVLPGGCVPGREEANPVYDSYGKLLLERKHPVLREFLLFRKKQLQQIEEALIQTPGDKAMKRLQDIRQELELVKEALREVS